LSGGILKYDLRSGHFSSSFDAFVNLDLSIKSTFTTKKEGEKSFISPHPRESLVKNIEIFYCPSLQDSKKNQKKIS